MPVRQPMRQFHELGFLPERMLNRRGDVGESLDPGTDFIKRQCSPQLCQVQCELVETSKLRSESLGRSNTYLRARVCVNDSIRQTCRHRPNDVANCPQGCAFRLGFAHSRESVCGLP